MILNPAAPDSILRHRPFALYWAARTCAAMGFQMLGVAVAWQMYALTGSAFDLGLVGLTQFLPSAAFMLVAGQVADRYHRRRLLQICQIIEGLAAAALAIGAMSGWASKASILATVFVFGVGRAFDAPTQQTLLATVVQGPLFPRAVAASASTTQVATITGPAIGGFLYAFGAVVPFTVCAALFLTSVVLLAFVHIAPPGGKRSPINLSAFFAGIAYIRHSPIVLGVISLDLFAVLLGGATALLPIFADEVFHLGPEGLGLLRAAPAAGALTIMALLTTSPLTRRVGHVMFVSVACFGVATIVFALSTSFALSMLALAVLGASDAVSVVIRMAMVQTRTPHEMLGRVMAVNSMCTGTSGTLGEFRSGVVAAGLGAVWAVALGGIGALLVVALWMRLFPDLVRIKSVAPDRSEMA